LLSRCHCLPKAKVKKLIKSLQSFRGEIIRATIDPNNELLVILQLDTPRENVFKRNYIAERREI
jgi:hypothetical protein